MDNQDNYEELKKRLKQDKKNIWIELISENDMSLERLKGKAIQIQSLLDFIVDIEEPDNEIHNGK